MFFVLVAAVLSVPILLLLIIYIFVSGGGQSRARKREKIKKKVIERIHANKSLFGDDSEMNAVPGEAPKEPKKKSVDDDDFIEGD